MQKQIFICILPRRSIWNRVKNTNLSVSEYCSGLQRTRKRSEHDASDLRQTHGSLYPELRDTPPDQRIPRNTDKNRTLRSIPPSDRVLLKSEKRDEALQSKMPRIQKATFRKTGTSPNVEVAGVEPASKQGTRKLSTRLSAVSSFYPGLAGGNLTRIPVPEFSHDGRNPPPYYL